ncbi:MAG: SsrA-binding protein SmpB [Armatimonadetes bacterium]|nr:SsrA-binding protein SmpB [Anaerolineae bacterium]
MASSSRKIITRNRKASHEYTLFDTYDAGLVLTGTEIKSIRNNQVSLTEGYVEERGGEIWLMNVHINPYQQASQFSLEEPLRPRKLLLHKKEIAKISDKLRERGYTAVPTLLYLERGRAKVEIALAKGKKLYDKRQAIAKRDAERDMRRELSEKY